MTLHSVSTVPLKLSGITTFKVIANRLPSQEDYSHMSLLVFS